MKQDFESSGSGAKVKRPLLRGMVILAAACCVLVLGSCSRKEPVVTDKAQPTPASKATPPPAEPAKTSLGVLAGTKRSEAAELQFVCMGNSKDSPATFRPTKAGKVDSATMEFAKSLYHYSGICISKEKPQKGSVFIILSFEGEGTRKLSLTNYETVPSRYVGMVDKASWLTDGQGRTFKTGFLAGVPSKTARQLAFVIPGDASDLTWHDGDAAFLLKP